MLTLTPPPHACERHHVPTVQPKRENERACKTQYNKNNQKIEILILWSNQQVFPQWPPTEGCGCRYQSGIGSPGLHPKRCRNNMELLPCIKTRSCSVKHTINKHAIKLERWSHGLWRWWCLLLEQGLLLWLPNHQGMASRSASASTWWLTFGTRAYWWWVKCLITKVLPLDLSLVRQLDVLSKLKPKPISKRNK